MAYDSYTIEDKKKISSKISSIWQNHMCNVYDDPDFENKKLVFFRLLPDAIDSILENSGRYTRCGVDRNHPKIISILKESKLCLKNLPYGFYIEIFDGKLTGTTPKGDEYDIPMS